MNHYLLVNATGTVLGVHRGDSPPESMDKTVRVREVSAELAEQIQDSLYHEDSLSLPAWRMEDDQPVSVPDPRPVLTVTVPMITDEGADVPIDFVADDKTWTKKIILEVEHDGTTRRCSLQVRNGTASVRRKFPVGSYYLRSGEPQAYRLDGSVWFEVMESWN